MPLRLGVGRERGGGYMSYEEEDTCLLDLASEGSWGLGFRV